MAVHHRRERRESWAHNEVNEAMVMAVAQKNLVSSLKLRFEESPIVFVYERGRLIDMYA